ncbi:hypothetical protein, partial [Vibrio vulnificus]|uniref:hypothetical protein n=1 Tax=Vibrio vulnificus TaxID=672 RepID=UPI001CDD8E15
FQLLLYNFGLSAFSFYPFSRHPHGREDPSCSECCGLVFPLHCQCCCQFRSMLLSVVSAFTNATSGVRG